MPIYAKKAHAVVERGQVSVGSPVVVGSLELKNTGAALSVHAPGLASLPGPPEILLTK